MYKNAKLKKKPGVTVSQLHQRLARNTPLHYMVCIIFVILMLFDSAINIKNQLVDE